MMCGVGAFAAAVFHLLAHGFLKAFLFLSTGNALAGGHAASRARARRAARHAGHWPRCRGGRTGCGHAAVRVRPAVDPVLRPVRDDVDPARARRAAASPSGRSRWPTVFLTAMYLRARRRARFRHELRRSAARSSRPQFFSLPHTLIVVGRRAGADGFFCWSSRRGSPAFLAPGPARRSTAPSGSRRRRCRAGRSRRCSRRSAAGRLAPWPLRRPAAGRGPALGQVGLYVFFWNKLILRRDLRRATSSRPNLRLARASPARSNATWSTGR